MAAPRTQRHPGHAYLIRVAHAPDGHLAATQAAEAGYSCPLLHKHLADGRIIRAAPGVARGAHPPARDREERVVLWLGSAQPVAFSHEPALTCPDLSGALPSKTHLTTPSFWQRCRLQVPTGLVLDFADVGDRPRTSFGAVSATVPFRTLEACAGAYLAPGFSPGRSASRVGAPWSRQPRQLSFAPPGAGGERRDDGTPAFAPLAIGQALVQRFRPASAKRTVFGRHRNLLPFNRFLRRLAPAATDGEAQGRHTSTRAIESTGRAGPNSFDSRVRLDSSPAGRTARE